MAAENIQELLPTVVKEEPPDDEPASLSFYYETVTKEEVILEEDQLEHADDQPESVSKTATEKSHEHLFQCSVCNQTFDRLFKLNRCLKRHDAIKAGRFECKICGKCFGTNYDQVRHEATHKKEAISSEAVIKEKTIEEDFSVEAAIPYDIETLQEELTGASDSSSNPALVVSYEDAFMQFTNDYTLYNKQSFKQHELTQQYKGSKCLTFKDVVESDLAADKNNTEQSQPDENSSYFCYETVTKEELIIEDDKLSGSAEDKQEEEFRFWMEEDEPAMDAVSSQQEGKSCETSYKSEQPGPNQTKCKMCHMTFNSEYALQMHYKTHNPVVMRSIMSEEFLVHNEEAQNYTCSFCEVTYPSRNQAALSHLQKHINIIDGIYQCKICGLRLGVNYAYQKHLKTHKNTSDQMPLSREKDGGHIDYESSSKDPCEKSDLPLHCKTCNVFFNNTANLNIHLWKSMLRVVRSKIDATAVKEQPVVNVEPFDTVRKSKTVKVKKVAVLRSKLKNLVDPVKKLMTVKVKKDTAVHSEIQRDEMGFFNCPKCAYKTNKKPLLGGHIRRHTAVELGLFPCDVCQRRCTDKKHLASHKEIHNKGDFIKCRTCNEKFETRAALYRHRIVHSKNEISRQFLKKVTEDERGVFTCSVCGKTDMRIRKYAFNHFRMHVLGKQVRRNHPHECEICQQHCHSKNSLERHMNTHEKLRFKCHTCKERFGTRPALMTHREKHKPMDVYQCSRCDEKFPTRQKVLEHFRVHLPAKPKPQSKTRTTRANTRRSKNDPESRDSIFEK